MSLRTKVCFVLLGTLFAFILDINQCRKLDGYKFPVYSTSFCPRNESEWNKRSSALNCNKTNGYTCLPNENFTGLLEFCYTAPWILIQEGFCLYLQREGSYVDSYSCSNFINGCHNTSYQSTRIFEYPACISIGNGCFLAEQSCKRIPTNLQETTEYTITENDTNFNKTGLEWIFPVFIVSYIVVLICICILYFIVQRRKFTSMCKTRSEEESHEEHIPFINQDVQKNGISRKKEPLLDKATFDQWQKDNICFVSTRASNEAERITKNQNLVIVKGNSGSGKSAIIQHIALKYREQGWAVKPVNGVEEIINVFSKEEMLENEFLFVFDDPIGKESFDEMLYKSWQRYEKQLPYYLKKAKLLISCRKYVLSDKRVTGLLNDESYIFDINSIKYRLNEHEKRSILDRHTSAMNLSKEQREEIIKGEDYFPLLCKLFSNKVEYKNAGINFFKEPIVVLEKEIREFREKDKKTYCGLVLLVLFNNDLRVDSLLKDDESENKFKEALKLCGLKISTAPYKISDKLDSHMGFFTKKIGNNYHFYHDFVMEVTTKVLGSDYPAVIIKYADIGFLRNRVKLETREIQNDSFTIYVNETYIKELADRFFTDIFTERFLDVVLNPCLMNKKIVAVFEQNINENHHEKLQMLVEKKEVKINKQELNQTSKKLHFSELAFFHLENEVSVLFALILFRHTNLSLYCLEKLQKVQANLLDSSLFSAVCCNGSQDLFDFFLNKKECLTEKWGGLFPIHILTVFRNSEMLERLIDKTGVNVNLKTETEHQWNPLVMLTGMKTERFVEETRGKSGKKQNDDKELSLSNKTHIVSCLIDNVCPLYIACFDGNDCIVQLLLSKRADINLRKKNGESPLYIASKNGHHNTVQLLLTNGANVNLCTKDKTSPLTAACFDGHDSTVQLLLHNGANINLCDDEGFSPLHVACQSGHDSTVQLLLNNGAEINLCKKNGASPLYVACENGHRKTVQILLENNADIKLCIKDGTNPLIVACFDAHDDIVKLLLDKGAEINSRDLKGFSPLITACQNGHDSTVKILLNNGADINLCRNNGVSPIFVACGNGHQSTVQLLLNNKADINLLHNARASPLYYACQKGQDNTVQFLLNLEANINLCIKDGVSPLCIAFEEKHCSTVKILLNKNADTRLACGWELNPDLIDCFDKNDKTVEYLQRQDNIVNNMYDPDSYFSLFIFCQVERVTRIIHEEVYM